jgi:histidinol-phosphate/aromatic aminotransferase/cobyric acid decarboxylase-like protein
LTTASAIISLNDLYLLACDARRIYARMSVAAGLNLLARRSMWSALMHLALDARTSVSVTDQNQRITIAWAKSPDREIIYRHRHAVYAVELRQHARREDGRLCDAIDAENEYIVARVDGRLAGFISVTPPNAARYSLEKYVPRQEWPVADLRRAYEIRLLTVIAPKRGRTIAAMLMYAALRVVEARGGDEVVAMGRREVLGMYDKAGLQRTGVQIRSGAVDYEMLTARVAALHARADRNQRLIDRLQRLVNWRLDVPLRRAPGCYHGGSFFQAIGAGFENLNRRNAVINADVLDAWFDPSPRVIEALREHLPWLLRTSPPTGCEGLIRAIARARGVANGGILSGAGSSDLMFRALPHWVSPASRVLLLDPTYGEYAHVLESVLGACVERFELSSNAQFRLDLDAFGRRLREQRFDLAVVVNPNSPTGTHIDRGALIDLIRRTRPSTRFWIDEAYIDYVHSEQSLEHFAQHDPRTIVCKTMSKVYALSGARVAYLCAHPSQLAPLRSITPPWVVGLPAQVAAVAALGDPQYYVQRWRETHRLRDALAAAVERLPGVRTFPGVANLVLCRLNAKLPDAETVVAACRRHGLYLRDAQAMGRSVGPRMLRIAVKDAATNAKIVAILADSLSALQQGMCRRVDLARANCG